MTKKVFVFGIDGAPPELIFNEWLEDLPNIKKLVQNGTYSKLNSTIPPVSAVAWTSIYTGKYPKDHGLFDYTYRKNNSYSDIHVISANNVKEKSVWEILSENNKKTIACLTPLTWPIKPFDGTMVTGFLTPGIEKEYTSPSELKQEIETLFGGPFIIDIADHRSLSKEDLLKKIYEMTEMHFMLMDHLIKNKEWDLFFGVIMGSDRMNHNFWKYFDKEHRRYEYDPKFEKSLKEYYMFLDKRLGELIELLDEDTTIIILSDHGIKRMDTRVNLSDWLVKEGYMVLKEPIKEKCKFDMDFVDWNKTKVFARGAWDGQVFINLKGREQNGIVSKEDYNELIEEVAEKLKKIPGDDGKILNTKIFKKSDYSGKYDNISPDMIVYFDDLHYGCNTSLIGNDTLWSPATVMGSDEVTHSQKGIFITNNSKKGNLGEIEIIDIAPTILNELGITIPKDMEGEIIN
jgi:predicted AlkP superfamily phosphohydrolase/phosphomutase